MSKLALEALEFALLLLSLAILVVTARRGATRATAPTGVQVERHERFLDGASHELRTPLTIARGHLELLQRQQREPPDLGAALDALARIERIVESLLLRAAAPPAAGEALRREVPPEGSRDGFAESLGVRGQSPVIDRVGQP